MAVHSPNIIVDKKDQLKKIEEYCLSQETIHAVFDLKSYYTGFISIADKQLVYYAKSSQVRKRQL